LIKQKARKETSHILVFVSFAGFFSGLIGCTDLWLKQCF